MTYDDIMDWVEATYPEDNYDEFDSWVSAVRADFTQNGHELPEGGISRMRESWTERDTPQEVEDAPLTRSERIRQALLRVFRR